MLAEAENIDRKLGSAGELSNPEFREMLIHIIESLNEHHGGGEVLDDVAGERTAQIGAITKSLAEAPSAEVDVPEANVTEPVVDRVNTAVMDVITPETIAEYRK